MRKKLKSLLLFSLFVSLGFGNLPTGNCQGGIDDPGCPPAAPGEPEQCPIDGGLAFLLLVGAGYGIKKYRLGTSHKPGSAVEKK